VLLPWACIDTSGRPGLGGLALGGTASGGPEPPVPSRRATRDEPMARSGSDVRLSFQSFWFGCTRSSSRESKSFRIGDEFDLLYPAATSIVGASPSSGMDVLEFVR
jgi:hypothetical protein